MTDAEKKTAEELVEMIRKMEPEQRETLKQIVIGMGMQADIEKKRKAEEAGKEEKADG